MVRNKEARKLIRRCERAGGTVTEPAVGKIVVVGPDGSVQVGDNLQGREAVRARTKIERVTGLRLDKGTTR